MDPPEDEYKSITTPPPVELHITLLECMGIFIKAIPHLFPHSKKAVCFLGLSEPLQCIRRSDKKNVRRSEDGSDENERMYGYRLDCGLVVSARGTPHPPRTPLATTPAAAPAAAPGVVLVVVDAGGGGRAAAAAAAAAAEGASPLLGRRAGGDRRRGTCMLRENTVGEEDGDSQRDPATCILYGGDS